MADEQLEWVFDSLVEFLRGPIWNIPVLTFIEQKSVVFEPGAENEDEFKKIHEAYKNLVDFMLGSYMEDLKITPDEFEKSCSVASKKALNQFHQSLFQQVWAADDFEIFKRMMTQKNLELQLQALEYLTQRRGSVPDCLETCIQAKDENEMEEIIKNALEDSGSEIKKVSATDSALQEKMKQEAEKEKHLLEEAIKQSVKAQSTTPDDDLSSGTILEEKLQNTPEVTNEDTPPDSDDPKHTDCDKEESGTPSKETEETKSDDETPNPDSPREESNFVDQCSNGVSEVSIVSTPHEDSRQPLPLLKAPEERPWSEGDSNAYTYAQVEVSPLELEKRQNYLRQQRDRLLAMKKQERARRFSTSEEVTSQTRPKSAKAARKILREETTDIEEPHTLVFRKTLAAKLRSEVVDRAD